MAFNPTLKLLSFLFIIISAHAAQEKNSFPEPDKNAPPFFGYEAIIKETLADTRHLDTLDQEETTHLEKINYKLEYTVMLLPDAPEIMSSYLFGPNRTFEKYKGSTIEEHLRTRTIKAENLKFYLSKFLENMLDYFDKAAVTCMLDNDGTKELEKKTLLTELEYNKEFADISRKNRAKCEDLKFHLIDQAFKHQKRRSTNGESFQDNQLMFMLESLYDLAYHNAIKAVLVVSKHNFHQLLRPSKVGPRLETFPAFAPFGIKAINVTNREDAEKTSPPVSPGRTTVIIYKPRAIDPFMIPLKLNEQNECFMLDTRAKTLCLSLKDAEKLKIKLDESKFHKLVSTSSGLCWAAKYTFKELTLGRSFHLTNVLAFVCKDLETSVAGMNLFENLERVTESNVLILRKKNPKDQHSLANTINEKYSKV